ncbi:MAG: YggS family pyridoxal phosphate-dependent enzyme [Candidatus Acetothermia bacterium]|nr:YggS family pyridoxal phosphate-dependent enzyme [Candidatus Acetothermia bacterium]
MEVFERWDRIRRALPPGVTVVAAAKGRTPDEVRAALAAGIGHVGENYVQEAERKKAQVPEPATWHMIGRLQTNKASRAAGVFDWVQTVDSRDLAWRLSAAAGRGGKTLPVLLQVNIGRERQKGGVLPEDVLPLAEAVRELPGLELRGLMALPPEPRTPEDSRPYFRAMRRLLADLCAEGFALDTLSMGMSADWEVALEEGATMIRLGTALFGPRS